MAGGAGNVTAASDLAVDGAGRILVAGRWSGSGAAGWAVVRLDATGAPDPGYGSGSQYASPDPLGGLRAWPDGAAVVAVSPSEVIRLDPAGAPDPAFGGRGRLAFGNGNGLVGLEPLADGHLLVTTNVASSCTVQVSRHDASGALDPTFGTGGSTCISTFTVARAFTTDGAGRALVAGITWVGAVTVYRLDAGGQPDVTFGTGGAVTVTTPPANLLPSNMLLAATGTQIALATNDLNYALVPERGTVLTWFDSAGQVTRSELLPSDLLPRHIAFDAAGRLHLVAAWNGNGHESALVLRFQPPGP